MDAFRISWGTLCSTIDWGDETARRELLNQPQVAVGVNPGYYYCFQLQFTKMRVMLLLILAVQNLTAATSSVFTMTPIRDQVSKTGYSASNDEFLTARIDHILRDWFLNEPKLLNALWEESIIYWYDYACSVENMDEINSVKNRSNNNQYNSNSTLSSHTNIYSTNKKWSLCYGHFVMDSCFKGITSLTSTPI